MVLYRLEQRLIVYVAPSQCVEVDLPCAELDFRADQAVRPTSGDVNGTGLISTDVPPFTSRRLRPAGSTILHDDHAYTVDSVNAVGVVMYNPWGGVGATVTVPLADLNENINTLYIGDAP